MSERFLEELKRRHVYRVGAAYAVVGWVLIEVATQVFPVFHFPDWAAQLVVLFILIGFPIVVVLAWAFDATPQGVVRTADAPNFSPRRSRHAGIAVGLIAVLFAAMVGGGYWWWHRGAPKITTLVSSSNPVASSQPSAGPAIPEKSIAVLPFENLSSDKDNAYFADGVQDEILTDLARIADLKVISRTSVMQYREAASRNLRKIGQELGVAHVLEGSVQRASGKVRVNAQLIDVGPMRTSGRRLMIETWRMCSPSRARSRKRSRGNCRPNFRLTSRRSDHPAADDGSDRARHVFAGPGFGRTLERSEWP